MDNGGFYGILPIDDTLRISALFKNNNESPTNPTSPIAKIYNGDTQIGSNLTLTQIDSQTGYYGVDKLLSTGNGFAAGEEYDVIVTGSVSGTSKGYWFRFQIQ